MERSKALVYSSFGKPAEVIRLEELPLPKPGPGEVLLRVLVAPVHPSDFGMILGKYGRLKSLPAVAGREGVAEVMETGDGVTGCKTGDRVMVRRGRKPW